MFRCSRGLVRWLSVGARSLVVFLVVMVVAWLSVLLTGQDAQAIPAFARKYDMDCSHCHVMAPKLNRVGYKFHDNFTLKNALADLDPKFRDRVKSEDPEDIHPSYWPLSIRVAGGYQYNKRDNQLTDGNILQAVATRTFAIERFELLAGGLLAPGISYYLSYYPEALNVGLPGQPPIHAHPGAVSGSSQTGAIGFAWVRFADLLGQADAEEHHDTGDADGHPHEMEEPHHEHTQDLIVGSHELHLTISGHHRLTNTPYLAYRYDPRVPANSSEGLKLDAPQLGASLDGGFPLFDYAVSVYNGTSSSADDNRALDFFGTITEEIGDHRMGLFLLRGTAPTSSVQSADVPPVTIPGTGKGSRPFYRGGVNADLNFGPMNLMLFALYGQIDKDLFGTSSAAQTAKFYGGFVEGDYMIESVRTMVIGRYDAIRNISQGLSTNPDNQGDVDAFTLAVRHDVVLTSRVNLQFHAEANTTTTKAIVPLVNADQTTNTLFAGVDWSF